MQDSPPQDIGSSSQAHLALIEGTLAVKYKNTQIHKYTFSQIHKYTDILVVKYTNTLAGKYIQPSWENFPQTNFLSKFASLKRSYIQPE